MFYYPASELKKVTPRPRSIDQCGPRAVGDALSETDPDPTLGGVNARAALFDLYGDHLRSRGGRASVAALVRLLASLDFAAPAVRTAISRMVRQGWLDPVRLPPGPGYAVTPKCVRRLDETAVRVYRTGTVTWSGQRHVLVVEAVRDRPRRERLKADLAFLGYAALSETTWIGPHASPELDALGIRADRFDATLQGDPCELVRRAGPPSTAWRPARAPRWRSRATSGWPRRRRGSPWRSAASAWLPTRARPGRYSALWGPRGPASCSCSAAGLRSTVRDRAGSRVGVLPVVSPTVTGTAKNRRTLPGRAS